MAPLIAGSEVKEYAAHLIPEGGYKAIPQLFGDGWVVVGDAAQFDNAVHREGSNLAMTSGRIAAEAIFQIKSRRDPMTEENLALYKKMLDESFVMKDLKKYKRHAGPAAHSGAELLPDLSAARLEGDEEFPARRRHAEEGKGEEHVPLLPRGAFADRTGRRRRSAGARVEVVGRDALEQRRRTMSAEAAVRVEDKLYLNRYLVDAGRAHIKVRPHTSPRRNCSAC